MSRSYKKVGGYKDSCKGMKRFANKKVRHTKNIPSGKAYKKLFCSYSISDYSFLYFSMNEIKRHIKKMGDWTYWGIDKLYKYYRK